MKDKISIIVPCFNEEACIDEFYRKTQQVAEEMRMKEGADYELLFVDDGSCDGTLDCLRKISQADSRCRFISFSRNFGKEAAMYAGLNEAAGNFAVFMDADLQHPPALLPKMYGTRKRPRPFDALGGGHLLVDTESETAHAGPSPGRGGSGLTSSHEMME